MIGNRCLRAYIACLFLLVLVSLLYQTYALWRSTQRGGQRVPFDREQMCRNINTSVTHSCRDPSCAEYLSNTSLQSFATCFNKTWSGELDAKYIHRGCCHFMSGEKRQTVLLASYPGSGNTWARGLLESTTGICTGSIYCDRSIRRSGFIGELVTGSEVLVVKTHSKESWMDDKPAIYIVRDPANAFVSYWNYRSTPTHSHRRRQPLFMFGNNTDWNTFFFAACKRWRRSILKWTNRPSNASLLVVSYEDMVDDRLREMTRMLKFLQLPFARDNLQKWLQDDFSRFHRSVASTTQQYYTSEQRHYLLNTMNGVHRQLKRTHHRKLASIVQSYLDKHKLYIDSINTYTSITVGS